jgi:hypothetical protein
VMFTITPPSQGYSGTINWGVSGGPSGTVMTFSPNPVMLSATPITTGLQST